MMSMASWGFVRNTTSVGMPKRGPAVGVFELFGGQVEPGPDLEDQTLWGFG
jgi:hypothetical protein